MTNEERKASLLARWNAPGSRLAIRTLNQMENLCGFAAPRSLGIFGRV
jgi:hypothetical protein